MKLVQDILLPNTKKTALFDTERKIRLLNLIIVTNILAAIIHFVYAAILQHQLLLLFSSIAIISLIVTYVVNYYHHINFVSFLLVVFACIYVLLFTYFIGDVGLEYYFFAGILLMSLIFSDRPRVVFFIFCLMIITFVIVQRISQDNIVNSKIDFQLLKYMNISICVFVIYMTMKQYHQDLRKSLDIIKDQNQELEFKNQQILFQKTDLEQSNEAKNKILSILAHDLKSPINSLRSTLFLLKQKALKEEDQTKIIDSLYTSTNHTSEFMDQLLIWGKNQFEQQHTSISEFDLTEVADNIVQLMNHQAQTKNITIEKDYIGSIIQNSDKELIHTSIRNLLNNAIKFTPLFGKIALSIKKQNDEIIIQVSDTGVGISVENIASIFSSKMISSAGTMEEKGTGLGLLLVKECVEKCMGKIQLISIPGFNTSFQINMPIELNFASNA